MSEKQRKNNRGLRLIQRPVPVILAGVQQFRLARVAINVIVEFSAEAAIQCGIGSQPACVPQFLRTCPETSPSS